MMWDILPDISSRETGGSRLCTRTAAVGHDTLLSIFSCPTLHYVIMQCGILGGGYRQKGEETQDVRSALVSTSTSSSSVKTLLGDLGRVISEWYVNKKHDAIVRFLFVWWQKPHRRFLPTLLKQVNEKTAFVVVPFKMDENGLFTLVQQLTDLSPSRVQCTNTAWNRTPAVALLSPVALIYAVSPPPPFSMAVFALVYLAWLQTLSDKSRASALLKPDNCSRTLGA